MNRSKIFLFGTLIFFAFAPLAQADFLADLGYGARNSDVTALQNFLTQQGLYAGPVTGNYFTLTQKAVRAFQAREGIAPVSGYFGPKSRARANALLAKGNGQIQSDIKTLGDKLVLLQKQLAAAATTSPTSAVPTNRAPETLVNPRSIVGLDCTYLGPGGQTSEARASGVILTPDGYILTVRHLVDLKFSRSVDPGSVQADIADNYALDHCDVGQVPAGSVLPSAEVIRSLNPFIPVPILAYTSKLFYVPLSTDLSTSETQRLDFAILKITGVSAAGRLTGTTALPTVFDYSLLDRSGDPPAGTQILTYGYPGDIARNRNDSFSQMYLLGGMGKVKEVYGGDALFLNKPFIINTEMEVRSGRSGSPVFVDGKVVGIVLAHAVDNVVNSFLLSSGAIYRTLSGVIPNLP